MFHRKKECVEERESVCVCVRTEKRERGREEARSLKSHVVKSSITDFSEKIEKQRERERSF